MKKIEFIQAIKNELEIESDLTETTNLSELEEWDSLSWMVLNAYVSNTFEVSLTAEDYKRITTVESVVEIIGYEKFD